MELELVNVEARYVALYRRHWNTIKNSIKRGVLKDVYHFTIIGDESEKLEEYLTSIRRDIGNRKLKINAAFGFILENRTTEELKFFHPSNNNRIFDSPRLVANQRDFTALLADLERNDLFDYARTQRPNTNWIVRKVICVRFDVTKL